MLLNIEMLTFPTGRKLSEETKKKMSLAHLGKKRKPHSEKTKRKIGKANKGRYNLMGQIWNPTDGVIRTITSL